MIQEIKKIIRIVRTDEDINEQLELINNQILSGETKFPELSYEDGLQIMFDWLTEFNQLRKPMNQ